MSTYDEAVKDIKKAVEILDANPKALSVEKHPDPLKHKYISFVKSGFRIGAGIALVRGELIVAGALFIIAEVLGIVEELV